MFICKKSLLVIAVCSFVQLHSMELHTRTCQGDALVLVSKKFEDLFCKMINDVSFYSASCWRDDFKTLLFAGANPNIAPCDERCALPKTPLSYMCEQQEVEIVKFLLQLPSIEVNFSPLSYLFRTPLERACENRNYELMNLLFEAGADPNYSTLTSPLMKALAKTNVVADPIVVECLLKNGANPNRVTSIGETALLWTAAVGDVKIMELLIAYKANVNRKNNHGRSVLEVLLGSSRGISGLDTAAPLLINAGFNINSCNRNGKTILHKISCDGERKRFVWCAVGDNNIAPLVSTLMDNGANPSIKDNLGNSAFDYASRDDVKEVLMGRMLPKKQMLGWRCV